MTSTRATGWWRRGAMIGPVVAIALATAACDPPECVPPYVAVAQRFLRADSPPEWPDGSVTRTLDVGFDTDGDGTTDAAEPAVGTRGTQVTVHRTGGDLVLTGHPQITLGADVGPRPAPRSYGDIDGDGRSDVVVVTYDASGAADGFFVVPGATADGTYDPATVGIGIPTGARGSTVAGGDLNGNGTADLAFDFVSPQLVLVIDGADVSAFGPGGTYDPATAPHPATQVTGKLLGAVPFAPGLGALAFYNGTFDLWIGGGRLSFAPIDGFHGNGATARIADGDDGTIYLVGGDGEESTAKEWAWNLGDLCAGARAQSSTTTSTTTPSG